MALGSIEKPVVSGLLILIHGGMMKGYVNKVYYNGKEWWVFTTSPLCFHVWWCTDGSITMDEFLHQQMASILKYKGEWRPAW